MKYQIIGKNVEITKGIQAALEKKLSRMSKYFIINENVTCRVVVNAFRDGSKVEITVFTPYLDLRAEVKHDDFYSAVDIALDKLESQMRKLKTRMDRSKNRLNLGRAFAFENIEAEKNGDINETIVRTKSLYLEPMSIDEAITRMNALGHDFFIYLDEEDNRISVVYHRKDGGFGILQAENQIK
ncbi:MAG: ribosome-associated translation inhibitor RaiA [Bacilli bacterium]|jgi:putative sigma-54 modulation protein|nr:ribosome-associated translation inhibitor RaiA [Erysipelotrichia bacterium]